MGAGYVLGTDPVPIMAFSARVGGPLSTARAEAASLLQLLLDVQQHYSHQAHLLVFVDCLVVLDILQKWGRSDFHPRRLYTLLLSTCSYTSYASGLVM